LFGYVACLSILPLITIALKQQIRPEPINPEMEATIMGAFSVGLFCWYYNRHITESELVNTLICISMITLILQVFQNLFPEAAMFGTYQEDVYNNYGELQIASERNGILSFRIATNRASIVCLFFFWCRLLRNFTFKDFLFFLCFSVSIYLNMTRQVLGVIAFVLLYSYAKQLGSGHTIQKITFGFVSIFLLYYFWDDLFGNLIGMLKDDTYTIDIRGIALPYIFNESSDNIIQFLFGHGGLTERENIWEQSGIYISDVGFVGELFRYGLVWILMYFGFIIYSFKKRRVTPHYINLFLLATFLDCIFIFPYRNVQEIFVWVICLYIMSLHLRKDKESILPR
jgi:hypothetical protein